MATDTTTSKPERLWSIEDLADYLAVPVSTIHRWRTYGHGPKSYKVGRHIRFRPTEVSAWLDEQAQEPTPWVEPAAPRAVDEDDAFWGD